MMAPAIIWWTCCRPASRQYVSVWKQPCHSRHAAEASNHIWKHKYGVTLFDDCTPAWQKDWARRQFQDAILRLALIAA